MKLRALTLLVATFAGACAHHVAPPGKPFIADRHPAPNLDPRPPDGLPPSVASSLVAEITSAATGPFLARTKTGGLVAWVETPVQGGARLFAVAIDANGAPKGDSRPVANAPPEAHAVVLRAARDGARFSMRRGAARSIAARCWRRSPSTPKGRPSARRRSSSGRTTTSSGTISSRRRAGCFSSGPSARRRATRTSSRCRSRPTERWQGSRRASRKGRSRGRPFRPRTASASPSCRAPRAPIRRGAWRGSASTPPGAPSARRLRSRRRRRSAATSTSSSRATRTCSPGRIAPAMIRRS